MWKNVAAECVYPRVSREVQRLGDFADEPGANTDISQQYSKSQTYFT